MMPPNKRGLLIGGVPVERQPPDGIQESEAQRIRRLFRYAWFRIAGTTLSLVFLVILLFLVFDDGVPGGEFGYFWIAFYIGIACINYSMSMRDRVKAGRRLGDDLPLIAGLVATVVAVSVTAVVRLVD